MRLQPAGLVYRNTRELVTEPPDALHKNWRKNFQDSVS